MKWAHHSQRGFITQRNFLQNVLDVDAAARICGIEQRRPDKPTLVLWDIAAAFPSLNHRWIMMVSRLMRLPMGLQNFIFSLHKGNSTVRWAGGELALAV